MLLIIMSATLTYLCIPAYAMRILNFYEMTKIL
jgi:hypothetical protein